MFWNKKYEKGFIAIYTVIILIIILTILCKFFELEIMRNSNIKIQLKSHIQEDIYEEDRVNLFTSLNKYIKNNTNDLSIENIHNILCSMDKGDIYYKSSYVDYDIENRFIIINLCSFDGNYTQEKYKYRINNKNPHKIVFY